ncbi:hypothetical protein ASF61_07295 [Duganella sp. Leaf126]|nr:hypothetical protein ASF61_07295 [Duganella sp. Leaf126]
MAPGAVQDHTTHASVDAILAHFVAQEMARHEAPAHAEIAAAAAVPQPHAPLELVVVGQADMHAHAAMAW